MRDRGPGGVRQGWDQGGVACEGCGVGGVDTRLGNRSCIRRRVRLKVKAEGVQVVEAEVIELCKASAMGPALLKSDYLVRR